MKHKKIFKKSRNYTIIYMMQNLNLIKCLMIAILDLLKR